MSDYLFDPAYDTSSPVNSIPPQYQVQLEKDAPGITQIVASQKTPSESWFDSLTRLLPSLAATYQQKQLLDVQVERARQGLPPLNTSQYSSNFGVNVGVSPDTQKLLIYAGLGLAALFVFSTLSKKRS